MPTAEIFGGFWEHSLARSASRQILDSQQRSYSAAGAAYLA